MRPRTSNSTKRLTVRNVRHDAMPPYLVVLPRTTGGRALRNALHRRVNFVSPLALRFREQLQRRKLAAHLEITQRQQAARPYCCCCSAPSRKAPSSDRELWAWGWPRQCGERQRGRGRRLVLARSVSARSPDSIEQWRLEGSPEKCKVRSYSSVTALCDRTTRLYRIYTVYGLL